MTKDVHVGNKDVMALMKEFQTSVSTQFSQLNSCLQSIHTRLQAVEHQLAFRSGSSTLATSLAPVSTSVSRSFGRRRQPAGCGMLSRFTSGTSASVSVSTPSAPSGSSAPVLQSSTLATGLPLSEYAPPPAALAPAEAVALDASAP